MTMTKKKQIFLLRLYNETKQFCDFWESFYISCVADLTPDCAALKHPGREKLEINPQVCLLCFHSPSIMG